MNFPIALERKKRAATCARPHFNSSLRSSTL
jgi:hypothetical protein